jgi:deoxyribodipyrimidine photo-lyase
MIPSGRIQVLRDVPANPGGRYVLYWMQQSQRAEHNHALEYAVEAANALDLPTVVCFGLTAYPEANARHYRFMLEGLAETAGRLRARGVGFVIRRGAPDAVARDLGQAAALVVCDRGYLRLQRAWREALAASLPRRLVQVESDVVVPVEAASGRREYAARTLRPKIGRLLEQYLHPLRPRPARRRADRLGLRSEVDLDDPEAVLDSLGLDRSVPPVDRFRGGEGEARRWLTAFVERALPRYGADRGRPEADVASRLSPYLHFGQISALEIALAVRAAGSKTVDVSAYLEELVVRRELAMNHVLFEPQYDAYASLPRWARETLAAHAADPRPHLYTAAQFEAAETHDRYWNAAMLEMRATGYMHNRMRMYWGKKVLQWSRSPQEAWEMLLRLNNRWFLDGRDANAFANVGWIFGLHDRPWGPQPVFGAVRSMGANSLKAFDADAYVRAVEAMVGGTAAAG